MSHSNLRVDPEFLVAWVQAELDAAGESTALESRAALEADELGDDEARAEAAAALAEKRGLLRALEEAAEGLGPVEVRESRGGSDRLERGEPKLFAGPPACTAWLRAAPGAALRLRQLAEGLLKTPAAQTAELEGPLGGSPGCSVR